jgi:molybdenum cofactor biosynthesis enzyme
MDKLTYFSDAGWARMMDVAEKSNTQRVAVVRC